ncbi:MAG: hypothetical protein K2G67_01435 [Muribaculaceae bacterium]|nr:hypothetical protein [Muribaculaceae bacterium]
MSIINLICIDDLIKSGKTLSSGSKVKLPSGDDAEIYGFIATEDNSLSKFIDMPPLGESSVLSNRVIYYLDNQLFRFPIFKNVCKARDVNYELQFLYIPRFLQLGGYLRTEYVKLLAEGIVSCKLNSIEGVSIEGDQVFYHPNEYDLYFESYSKLRAIGKGFAIITRRISKLNDNVKYEIFDSYSVKVIKNDNL